MIITDVHLALQVVSNLIDKDLPLHIEEIMSLDPIHPIMGSLDLPRLIELIIWETGTGRGGGPLLDQVGKSRKWHK